jgi:uncharacterized protein
VLAGVSQDGQKFFYVNPLESTGNHHRSPWFGCACCPPNVARTLASLGGYAYAVSDRALYVNLYLQGSAKATVAGVPMTLQVTTEYPWDGHVGLRPELMNPAKFELRLRVPDWCSGAAVLVNKQRVAKPAIEQGYLVLARTWRPGDIVELSLPMPVQRVAAHPNVKSNHGLLALQRGPLVYCLEAADNPEALGSLFLPPDTELRAEKNKTLLGGITVIKGKAELAGDQDWHRRLYQPQGASRQVALMAIPYYAWDNREPGAMKVWLPMTPPVSPAGGIEARAKVSVSFANDNSHPQGINDGTEPKSSGEQPALLCHWWPHKGTEEWAKYTWAAPIKASGAKVYWFDDTGRGGCRLPASWSLQYLEGEDWKPVAVTGSYPVAKDKWCEVSFKPVQSAALRLLVKLPKDYAAGVHEWKIVEGDDE